MNHLKPHTPIWVDTLISHLLPHNDVGQKILLALLNVRESASEAIPVPLPLESLMTSAKGPQPKGSAFTFVS